MLHQWRWYTFIGGLNASDCICWKRIRLCHYFWSVCEIKSCCLFPLHVMSFFPQKSPKMVLGDSSQYLHSRASKKREINLSLSLSLSLCIQHICPWCPALICFCVPSVISGSQSPNAHSAVLGHLWLIFHYHCMFSSYCGFADWGIWVCTGVGTSWGSRV